MPGIRVERMLFARTCCRACCAQPAVFFYAARQTAPIDHGCRLEFQALTAVVLGGVSLAGGKGTVWRAMIGGLIVFMLTTVWSDSGYLATSPRPSSVLFFWPLSVST